MATVLRLADEVAGRLETIIQDLSAPDDLVLYHVDVIMVGGHADGEGTVSFRPYLQLLLSLACPEAGATVWATCQWLVPQAVATDQEQFRESAEQALRSMQFERTAYSMRDVAEESQSITGEDQE